MCCECDTRYLRSWLLYRDVTGQLLCYSSDDAANLKISDAQAPRRRAKRTACCRRDRLNDFDIVCFAITAVTWLELTS